jgi:hypothetical protein
MYLIELVGDMSPLGTKETKSYHNRATKPKILKEIGEKLNVTGKH